MLQLQLGPGIRSLGIAGYHRRMRCRISGSQVSVISSSTSSGTTYPFAIYDRLANRTTLWWHIIVAQAQALSVDSSREGKQYNVAMHCGYGKLTERESMFRVCLDGFTC